MYAHLLEAPPKVTEKQSGFSTAVDDAIATGMAKSRDDRYATPTEFSRALKQALKAEGAPAPPPARETILASAPPDVAPAHAADPAPATAAPEEAAPAPAEPAPARTPRQPWSRRTKLLLAGAGAVIVLAGVLVPVLALSRGDGSSSSSKSGAAQNLLAVLVPTQIAAECMQQGTPAAGAVETDVCVPGPAAPTSEPNHYQLSFYSSSAALLGAYDKALAQARGGTGGSGALAECGSTPAGVREWVHGTGKLGGRRFCYLDPAGSFVIVWTHEKRASPDHVDMLGIAREPGRAPVIYRSWWTGARNFLGKCRPAVSENVCAATIRKFTGRL
jgi:eukaryotic-like serine/threonine-protein kinase